MNSVKERVRKAIFAKLRNLRRKMNAQGIPVTYSRSTLSHEDGDNGFKITFQAVGTNGDMSLLPKLSLRTGESIEEFDSTNFDQGIARVKQMFHAQG